MAMANGLQRLLSGAPLSELASETALESVARHWRCGGTALVNFHNRRGDLIDRSDCGVCKSTGWPLRKLSPVPCRRDAPRDSFGPQLLAAGETGQRFLILLLSLFDDAANLFGALFGLFPQLGNHR